jgi:hypothetical protein
MILEGIEDIAGIKTWADLKKWMQDSGTRLEAFTETDGFESINGNRFLSGESGRVWKLKGLNSILKLTTDPEEINFANLIQDKNLPSFVKIEKTINLKGIGKQGESIPAQIRIQEICYPIDWSGLNAIGEYELLEWIKEYLDQIYTEYVKETKKTDINFEFVEFFLKALEYNEMYDADTEFTSSDKGLILKALQFGIRLLNDIQKVTGEKDLLELDLHDLNVMQDENGNWKMIDF